MGVKREIKGGVEFVKGLDISPVVDIV